MKIRTATQTDVTSIHIDPTETVIIEFCPAGVNANIDSPVVSFLIGTCFTPAGEMTLSITFPKNNTYRDPSNHRSMLLGDFGGSDKAAFMNNSPAVDDIVDLEKVS